MHKLATRLSKGRQNVPAQAECHTHRSCFTVMHAPTATAQSDTLEFSVQDARQIALRALDVDEFELARKLAMGLLLADATDSHAYTILMQAHAQLGHPKLAKAAARLAYQYSDGKAESFSAALNAGSLAFHNQKYNAAQFWLRRAANHEPDEKSAKVLAADYAKVRAANPLSFSINVSASPSDSLNNGQIHQKIWSMEPRNWGISMPPAEHFLALWRQQTCNCDTG